ncbi:hypothetical protein FORC69_5204 [Escherichia coli]|nr:Hypothetical protein FORC43_5269 [Escherichia coli]AXV27795.1 hypothetical protein FORC69_5204 [Escherichia coli]KDX08229.1 hypothetical protein AD27_2983 [Escherichia coli 2-177-06_S4_C3]CCQ31405.2 hypothetical protein HUS2011_4527 [Escherichia coli]
MCDYGCKNGKLLVLWHINGAFAEKMRGQKIILNFLLSGRNNSL